MEVMKISEERYIMAPEQLPKRLKKMAARFWRKYPHLNEREFDELCEAAMKLYHRSPGEIRNGDGYKEDIVADILEFVKEGHRRGCRGMLATLWEIRSVIKNEKSGS